MKQKQLNEETAFKKTIQTVEKEWLKWQQKFSAQTEKQIQSDNEICSLKCDKNSLLAQMQQNMQTKIVLHKENILKEAKVVKPNNGANKLYDVEVICSSMTKKRHENISCTGRVTQKNMIHG